MAEERGERRNDQRWIEDWVIAFAMYCDTNSMSRAAREELAENLSDAIQSEAGWFDDKELTRG